MVAGKQSPIMYQKLCVKVVKVLKQRVHRSTRKLSKLHLLSEHVFGKQIVISTRNTHFDYCNNETMKKIIYFNIIKTKT